MRTLGVALAAWSIGAAAPALALRVVDQTNLVDPASGMLLASAINRSDTPAASPIGQAQTVTAGRAGILAAVDLQLLAYRPSPRNEPLSFSIYDGALVEGSGSLIGTLQIAQADIPSEAEAQAGQLLTLDVSSFNYAVTAGQTFTIYTFIQPSGQPFGRGARLVYGYSSGLDEDGNPIAVGLDYSRGYNAVTFGNGSDVATQYDRGFRTYVDVSMTAVPEPEIWALLTFGFGLTGAVMRRRRPAVATPACD